MSIKWNLVEEKKVEREERKGNSLYYHEDYLKVSTMLFEPEVMKTQSNKTMLYLFITDHVWTISSDRDKHNIHNRYYVYRQTLATSWAEPVLADYFGVTDRTIRNWIRALEDDGLLRTEPDPLHKGQLVFMIGEYDKYGVVHLYRKETSARDRKDSSDG